MYVQCRRWAIKGPPEEMKAKDRRGNLWGKEREEVIRWAERQKVGAGCSLEHSCILDLLKLTMKLSGEFKKLTNSFRRNEYKLFQ